MIDIIFQNKKKIGLAQSSSGIVLDDKPASYEVIEQSPGRLKVLFRSSMYRIEVVSREDKTIVLDVNNTKVEATVNSRLDKLMKQLGIAESDTNRMKEIKAPMPGSILQILVEEGQHVKKGDSIMILEAMKMENILKCTGDGVVKDVLISENENVEKNQVLILFE